MTEGCGRGIEEEAGEDDGIRDVPENIDGEKEVEAGVGD